MGNKVKKIRVKKPKKQTKSHDDLPLPSDERIKEIASLLYQKFAKEKRGKQYASAKKILTLLGLGAFLSMAVIAPGTALVGKEILEEKRRRDWKEWRKYNLSYLRHSLKRFQQQKEVEIIEKDDKQVVVLTKKGKRKILKYALDQLEIPTPKRWDRKWRIVIWDVPTGKDHLRNVFRETIRSLGFLQLQESVFIYPFPCENEIMFLREYWGIGSEVIYIVAEKLENDSPYRDYFGV
jgi:hypothetical protein